jgi:hypothetical protein
MPSAEGFSLDELPGQLLAALCYFDVFGYPLTLAELRRHAPASVGVPTVAAVTAALVSLEEAGAVGTRDGFWFLRGQAATVDERQRRFRLAEPKYRRARLVARCLALLPSVRMIGVCNSLAWDFAGEESDIDFFVVLEPGTLWVTRLLASGTLAALGLRPTDATHADRICLSFLVSRDHLAFGRLAVPSADGSRPDDPYLHYWLRTLVPLYDSGSDLAALYAANPWSIDAATPQPLAGHRRRVRVRPLAWLLPTLRFFDRAARRLQLRLFPADVRRQANLSSDVLVSDDILKFHVHDDRRRYREEYRARLRRFGLA